MRQDVVLPEEDINFLNSLGNSWETIRDSNLEWLIIYDFAVPSGYGISSVDIAITIPPGYPIAPLDMAYFYPELKKVNGCDIRAANCKMSIDNKVGF